ncbi:hypothetical protein MVEN_00878500 [Mycena venus]|uniref:O-methyltransferase domain-containing protein n=1 Tax=Mycena venus TaxID=2733690 RepID=A0A8H6YFN3_9AGAR|nr:hypothetical protein MVEN_00878500 [Mycena venus]
MESFSTLRLLLNILTDAVTTIEGVYADAGQPLPSLDEPFVHDHPSEALKRDPRVSDAAKNIMAAASQMTALVCDPVTMVINRAFAFHISSCLRAASEINVVEILREAGSKGTHVKQIAAPSRTNPGLVARILRLLATHHIFREVSPDVFCNNRLSSTLDKEKSTKELFDNRQERLTGTSGVAALAESAAENSFKGSAFLADTLLQPDDLRLPFNLAFRTDEALFKFLQRPENSYSRRRFAVGMKGTAASDPPDLILQGFEWGKLPSGAVVVDVGGGVGHASLVLALAHPRLRIINQDLAPAIELSKVHWKQNFPTHFDQGLVGFQVHDFFTPQPVKDAAIFLLRYIIHDWTDAQAVTILKHLRESATATTQLVLLEKIIPVASTEAHCHVIPGAQHQHAPPPLLPNWGEASAEIYFYDMTMHNMLGGVERTVGGFVEILVQSGWKLVQIHHCPTSPLSQIVAIPV